MSEEASKRRMVENEAVFREYNERVRKSYDDAMKLARETGQEYLLRDDDTALHFYCECSDENCRKRIQMAPSLYKKIHVNRRHFVLLCGHETELIERIIRTEDDYCVVEKYHKPPEKARSLSPTGVNNS
ncbi:MAG TPA: hypothetical protein VF572_04225 [Candidatus Saccharimonadales bacterium]|jgi:hypothetical protein